MRICVLTSRTEVCKIWCACNVILFRLLVELELMFEGRVQGSTQGHWRFPKKRVEAGYAYIMTHPGTPCVFWDHWQDAKLEPVIAKLTALRRKHGLHCSSTLVIHKCVPHCHVVRAAGNSKCLYDVICCNGAPLQASYRPLQQKFICFCIS